jgi:predicted methyltransferase
MRKLLTLFVVLSFLSLPALASDEEFPDVTLQQAVKDPARNSAFVLRDTSRHPIKELQFFGIKPDMSVIEIWPSKGYWTEILAPYLHNHGSYYAAVPPGDMDKNLSAMLSDKDRYGKVKVIQFGKDTNDLGPENSIDAVLTFRNLHNWIKMDFADSALTRFYKVLRPGGVLGIEDHRGLSDMPQDVQTVDGYIREDFAIQLAQKAGFEYVGSSPINNNPNDTKRWPKGVWTLPPSYALGDQDHAKYEAVGEADNFVLLFRKPMKSP